MRQAIELAARGGRAVMPNPMVGAVLVCDGQVIGQGYHERYGGPHAEVHAVRSVIDQSLLSRASAYVTLEPCSHFGKTPPCADLIIAARIPHVVVGCRDPFPAVSGNGIQKLRTAGVAVEEGILLPECWWMNRRFLVAHAERRPYIILKWAETSDGFIARDDYSSKWISGELSRELVHRWRSEEMAIMVGTRTALVDDPSLTVRHVNGTNPLRVVLDLDGKIPQTAKLYNDDAPSLFVTERAFEDRDNCECSVVDRNSPIVPQILEQLYARNVTSLIVEGGAVTLQQFLDLGLWDEIRQFQSGVCFGGGIKAPSLVNLPSEAEHSSTPSGSDTLRLFIHPRLAPFVQSGWIP
jgi:diaminohydroxyphosphoribosylaminopyrimidine deaminase/5-amino-6-(5-phosphoribosylamino)uracil reductase